MTVPQLLFLDGLVERAVVGSRSGAVEYCVRLVREREGVKGPLEAEVRRMRRVKVGVSVSVEAVKWLDGWVKAAKFPSRSAVLQACVERAAQLAPPPTAPV